MIRPKSIEDLIEACTPQVRALVQSARVRVREAVPEASEKLRAGWGLIGYDTQHYFAFIAPMRDHVRIGFEWGVLLTDPKGLLEGEGSRVRYLSIHHDEELGSEALAAFLLEASQIPPMLRRPRKHASPSGA